VIKHFVQPTNSDTNTISIIWHNGLPRRGILSVGLSLINVLNTIYYFADTINPPYSSIKVELPEISVDKIKWRNTEDCTLKMINALTGSNVVDTIIIGADTYTNKTINVGGGHSIERPVYNSDEGHSYIDISDIPDGLYFLVMINPDNEVIYIKTINRYLSIIE
jgi:hypothetical protein